MKTLLILVLLSATAYADQSGDSFGTGFANSLQRALEARQQQAQQNQGYQAYPSQYFDLVDNYGNRAGYEFATFSQCERYIQNSDGLYKACILVQGR